MPTDDDIAKIISQTQTKQFYEVIDSFDLREEPNKKELRSNLFFNVEFAKITGKEINLSNKQKDKLKELSTGDGKSQMKIMNDDFSIQVEKSSLKRKPIGFVTRGEFS